jgi:hypothetical protein
MKKISFRAAYNLVFVLTIVILIASLIVAFKDPMTDVHRALLERL